MRNKKVYESSGGLSKGMSVEDIAKKHKVKPEQIEAQVQMGMKVEKEHTDSDKEAKRISLDHLFEIPDYYTRLAKMEKEATLKETMTKENTFELNYEEKAYYINTVEDDDIKQDLESAINLRWFITKDSTYDIWGELGDGFDYVLVIGKSSYDIITKELVHNMFMASGTYDEFMGDKEQALLSSLDEAKKKKKKGISVGDPNAKAMWGRTRHKVEKAKKGKGSFKRKKTDEALLEGTANFASMKHLPLIVWLDYETLENTFRQEAEEAVREELGDAYEDTDDFELEYMVQEKIQELSADSEFSVLDEEQFQDLELDKDHFNSTFINKYDWSGDIVTIEYGYYEGAYLYCRDENDLTPEQLDDVDEFLNLMKEKYFLTELEVASRGSNGSASYSFVSRGQGDNPVLLAPGEQEEVELDEEFITPSEELIEEFRQLIVTSGYHIESEQTYRGLADTESTHFQVRSDNNTFTSDNFREEFIRMADTIDNFNNKYNISITYNFGLLNTGHSTAGIDVREQWLDPNTMVSLETGERVSTEVSPGPRRSKIRVVGESPTGLREESGDDLETINDDVVLTVADPEAESLKGSEQFKQKYTDMAASLGAELEFFTDVSPDRLDSVWYEGLYIAELRYNDITIGIFTSGEIEIRTKDGEAFYDGRDLIAAGIYNDEQLNNLYDDADLNWEMNNWFDFSIQKEGLPEQFGGDMGYEGAVSLTTILDVNFYINEAIPYYLDYVGDETETTEAIQEQKGKPSKDDLKKAAKRHKKTDKKGSKGWFVNFNAGNVEQSIARFNHVSAGGPSAGEGMAPAGLGEDFEEDEIEVLDEPVKLKKLNNILVFSPIDAFYKRTYGNGYGRTGSKYKTVQIPKKALKVSKKDYLSNPIVKEFENVKIGLDDFFKKHPRRQYCVVELREPRTRELNWNNKEFSTDEYFRINIFTKLTKDAKPLITASDYEIAHKLLGDERTYFVFEDVEKKEESDFESEVGLTEKIEKHETLNPKLWEDDELKPEVKGKIKQIVDTFVEGLKEDKIKINVKDIIIIGSNASYNYNDKSDVDIHIIVDTEGLECPDNLYPLLYSAYRSIFNKKYDIEFYGFNVEIYVDTEDTQTVSNGIYSFNKGWIRKPVKENIPEIDQEKFDEEFLKWEEKYFDLIGDELTLSAEKPIDDINESVESDKIEDIDNFIEDIYDLRKLSLKDGGEYSIGNLIFKEMRSLGYLDALKNLKLNLKSAELSLAEGLLKEELDLSKYITKEALSKLASEVKEDGTYTMGEEGLKKIDITTDVQVSFFRPEITDDDIKLVLDTVGTSFGEPYLGLFNGSGEISYTIEISLAKAVARVFNQESVWNNELKKEEKNMSYDKDKKVNYKEAVKSLAELLSK